MKNCPHCGGELPRDAPKPTPKYPTAAARRAGLLAGYKAATDRRAAADRRDIYPRLKGSPFGTGELGEVLRRLPGRHYSENQAVLRRGLDRGWIKYAGQKWRGKRLVRVWMVAVEG